MEEFSVGDIAGELLESLVRNDRDEHAGANKENEVRITWSSALIFACLGATTGIAVALCRRRGRRTGRVEGRKGG